MACGRSTPLDLPPEIRTLIDFLDVDEKPTAILHAPKGSYGYGFTKAALLYMNAAWNDLNDAHPRIEQLCEALEEAVAETQDVTSLHGQSLGGKRWQIRISGTYIIAIERLQQRISNAATEQSNLDWTRFAIAHPSPWVQFLRSHNWEATGLGPMCDWDDALRSSMLQMMTNPNPRLIIYGENLAFIYNEAAMELFGSKHPHIMGASTKVAFAEAWALVESVIATAYRGEMAKIDCFELPMVRHGFVEETFWSFTILPLYDSQGRNVGAYDEITDETTTVVSERRRASVMLLGDKVRAVSKLDDLWHAALDAFDAATIDVPFAALYSVSDLLDRTEQSETSGDSNSSSLPKKCTLVRAVGLPEDHQEVLHSFALSDDVAADSALAQACVKAWKSGDGVNLSTEDGTLPSALSSFASDRTYGDSLRRVIVLPVSSLMGTGSLAIVVMGLNPRYPYNDEYKMYAQVLVDIVERNAALIALPEEQRRAQELADDVNQALAAQLRLTTQKAETSEANFTRLTSFAPTGMFKFDTNGRALQFNDAYLDMLGQTREQHDSSHPDNGLWHEVVHEDDLEMFINSWDRIREERLPLTIEYRTKKPWQSIDKLTGQQIKGETWLLATAFPELAADGTVTAVQGWLTDVSHKKFSESLLAQQLEDALENKRQTENFIDMTS